VLKSYCSGRLFADQHGTGPAEVVALHGWNRDRKDFTAVLDGLNALAIDLPGFGLSPPPPEAWGTEQYAASLLPVLSQISPPIVLGHSFGGRVALRLAALHPQHVRALVLTGVPFFRPNHTPAPALVYRLARKLHRKGAIPETTMERLRQRYGSNDYKNATGVMREIFVRVVNESYEADLVATTCPIKLVWGDHDTAAPISMAHRAAELAPTAELRTLHGIGHLVPVLSPGSLRDALISSI
jgi:pimeloyl-ACP methyl ester carboxylesterase